MEPFKKKWELALDLIDQVRGWGVPDRIVLADAGYGEATEFPGLYLPMRDTERPRSFATGWRSEVSGPRLASHRKSEFGPKRPRSKCRNIAGAALRRRNGTTGTNGRVR